MTVVLKLGGRVAAVAARQVAELRAAGEDVVVVHGAGPQITAELERRGIDAVFVVGRRVTTPEVLEVVRESFAEVNREVCDAIGAEALPLWGDEIGLPARQVEALGLVGDPEPSRPQAVVAALAAGRVPVVAPLAEGPLNVNADEAAAALAIGLDATRLVFMSDVPGVLVDGETASSLDADVAEAGIAAGAFAGGIVPKLEAAIRAVHAGVPTTIGATAITSHELSSEAPPGHPPSLDAQTGVTAGGAPSVASSGSASSAPSGASA